MSDIKKVRETFIWGQNYDENNNKLEKTKYRLLKELSNSHILGILKFFTDGLPDTVGFRASLKDWKKKHSMFIQELQYRLDNGIIIKDY